MRHAFETMGTVCSVDLPESHDGCAPQIAEIFRHYDERYSLYRPDSELSRIAAGALTLAHASAEVRATFERSNDWSLATGGLFSSQRPDGVLDLNGIVKAEAIEAAGEFLDDSGCPTSSINVGGDILVRTDNDPWITGIVDPANPGALLTSLPLGGDRRALATSGSAERGDHIWLGGRLTPSDFVQVSVAAADIVTADVLATAIVAGGTDSLDEITDHWRIDVLAVCRDGSLLATPGFRGAAAAEPRTA